MLKSYERLINIELFNSTERKIIFFLFIVFFIFTLINNTKRNYQFDQLGQCVR